MRVLLAHNSLYYPAHGGGDKSNRLLVEELAARGHTCRVVARIGSFGAAGHKAYLHELSTRSVAVIESSGGVVLFGHRGVEVHVVTSHPNFRSYFAEQIADLRPDVILSSTDDPAQMLLEAALKAASAHVVYLVRATLALPFGPDCAFPSARKTEALRRVDAVVGVSRYVAEYIRQWSGIQAVHVPISLLDAGPHPDLGRPDNEFVTLVNPCAVKGISILLALADRMPQVRFAAVPTWGTNAADRAALEERPNISILEPYDRIDDLLGRTRVLLVPSLWAEARSRIIVEAMLRGIPVLAANVGGIPEAMMGVDYVLPVRPIERYRAVLDEQMVPVAEVPEQNVEPWIEALGCLLGDRARYERLSKASRAAAEAYAANLGVEPFEQLLERVTASPKRDAAALAAGVSEGTPATLSPEKRRLLAMRLKKTRRPHRAAANLWFPGAEPAPGSMLRLFAFPHAGGGVSAFHGWRSALAGSMVLCPVRLPGRESRGQEPPLASMEELIEALADAVEPYLDAPFAFFGHSMGAAVAFELARALRARCRSLPAALLVSGARAPQFRLGHVPPPEPTESAFLEELKRLEGVPRQVLENAELLRVALPSLKADAALYRRYAYVEGPPLSCPIRAYGGVEDPNVSREHLEAWAGQTEASFKLRMFAGGHFFLTQSREALLKELVRDLAELGS
jgi:surfactin synthase thioesterase subunit/glycosyltransferase involved in cell wall biosynthesis